MKPHDAESFGLLFADVMAYYRQDTSDFMKSLYWNALSSFTLQEVLKAFEAHAKDPEQGRFAPKVADLVKILAGTTTDRAALAWGKIHEAMASVGAYTDVVFDDAAIHAAAEDCGGWPKMCRTDLKELSYLQTRFQNSYKAYVGRGQFDYPKRLGGDRSPDSEYEKKGLPLPRPALVGDPETAKLVYRGGGSGKTAITFASAESMALGAFQRLAQPEGEQA